MLWASIVATIVLFHPVSAAAAWLLVPYLAWVSFASALNFSIWRRNPRDRCREGRPMKPRWIEVNDRMQQGYRYALVAPAGRDFHPEFRPDLTPAEMLALGVFGGKYMTDCRDEFPESWFAEARLSPERQRSLAQLVRRGCQPAAQRLASQGLDPSRRSARLVPVVLPLLPGPPDARRGRAADRPLEGHSPPYRSAAPRLRARRLWCRPRQRQALLHWAYDSRSL